MNQKIPRVGFGLWKVNNATCAETVLEAIKAGYRHFDSAADYGNEKEVGQGLAIAMEQGLCTREELWVTSKLWNTFHHPDHVKAAFERTLADLGLDYLDLYLIHFPIALDYVDFDERYPPEWFSQDGNTMKRAPVPLHATWAAMETLVDEGHVKQIGVCNYNSGLIHDLMSYARIKPAMLQIEAHPYLTQEKLIRLAHEYEIDVTAFSPLGAMSYVEIGTASKAEFVINQPQITAIAERHGKTPAQIVLRWGVQRGTAIIPKTVKPARMRENLNIMNFNLNDEEMRAVSDLNKNRRFNDPGVFCDAAFGTFHPIYD